MTLEDSKEKKNSLWEELANVAWKKKKKMFTPETNSAVSQLYSNTIKLKRKKENKDVQMSGLTQIYW